MCSSSPSREKLEAEGFSLERAGEELTSWGMSEVLLFGERFLLGGDFSSMTERTTTVRRGPSKCVHSTTMKGLHDHGNGRASRTKAEPTSQDPGAGRGRNRRVPGIPLNDCRCHHRALYCPVMGLTLGDRAQPEEREQNKDQLDLLI